jgi:hypothetical protein
VIGSGKDLGVVFTNFEKESGLSSGVLLFRRWSDRKPPAALSDEESNQVRRLISQLGGPDLSARDKATQGLLTFGERALPLLDKAVVETTDAEVRARLDALQKPYRPDWWKN